MSSVFEILNQQVYTSAVPPLLQNDGSITRFYTTAEIDKMSTYAGAAFDPVYARDCGEVIGRHLGGSSDQAQNVTLKFQQIVDVAPTKSLFLHSQNLDATRSSLGCRGERTILCKIPLTVPFGNYQHHQAMTLAQHFDVSNQEIGVLSFYVTSSSGGTVDFRGTHLSFSIVLFEKGAL